MTELVEQNERDKEFNLFSVLKDTFVVFIRLSYFFVATAFVMSYVNRLLLTISRDTLSFSLNRHPFLTNIITRFPMILKIVIEFINVFSIFLGTLIISIVSVVCVKKVFAFHKSDFLYIRENESIFNLVLAVFKKAFWPIAIMTIYLVSFDYLSKYIGLWLIGKERTISDWLTRFVVINISPHPLSIYSTLRRILGFSTRWLLYDIPLLLVLICYDMNISNHSDIFECFKKMTKGIFLKIVGIFFLTNLFYFLIVPPLFDFMYLSLQWKVLPRVLTVICVGFSYAFIAVMYLKMKTYSFVNGLTFIPSSMWKFQKK